MDIVDQALAGANAVLNGNCNSALLVFFPVPMSKADQTAALKKKRLLEDKLMQNLSCFDVMQKLQLFVATILNSSEMNSHGFASNCSYVIYIDQFLNEEYMGLNRSIVFGKSHIDIYSLYVVPSFSASHHSQEP